MSTEPAYSTKEFIASTGFVGRRQELDALRLALEEALSAQESIKIQQGVDFQW
jgi:hypothetical protein